jgi:predicted TIM-barrel fold metal-dependent hydrolase
MMIVDSQVHIWAPDTPERPWPPGQAARHPVPQQSYRNSPRVVLRVERLLIFLAWQRHAARLVRQHRRAKML